MASFHLTLPKELPNLWTSFQSEAPCTQSTAPQAEPACLTRQVAQTQQQKCVGAGGLFGLHLSLEHSYERRGTSNTDSEPEQGKP